MAGDGVEQAFQINHAVGAFAGPKRGLGNLLSRFSAIGIYRVLPVSTRDAEPNKVAGAGPLDERSLFTAQHLVGAGTIDALADQLEMIDSDLAGRECVGELAELAEPATKAHIAPGLCRVRSRAVTNQLGNRAIAGVFSRAGAISLGRQLADEGIETSPQLDGALERSDLVARVAPGKLEITQVINRHIGSLEHQLGG